MLGWTRKLHLDQIEYIQEQEPDSCLAWERRWLVQAHQRLCCTSPPFLWQTECRSSSLPRWALLVGLPWSAQQSSAYSEEPIRDCVVSRHRFSGRQSVGLHRFPGGPYWWGCLGQPSNLQRTRKNRSMTSCFQTSPPRVMSPLTWRSQKSSEASTDGNKMVRVTDVRHEGGHSFWTE